MEKMAMDEKRKGEIALALLKYKLKREGIPVNELRRELGNVARHIGVPIAELNEFVKLVANEVIEESLGK